MVKWTIKSSYNEKGDYISNQFYINGEEAIIEMKEFLPKIIKKELIKQSKELSRNHELKTLESTILW